MRTAAPEARRRKSQQDADRLPCVLAAQNCQGGMPRTPRAFLSIGDRARLPATNQRPSTLRYRNRSSHSETESVTSAAPRVHHRPAVSRALRLPRSTPPVPQPKRAPLGPGLASRPGSRWPCQWEEAYDEQSRPPRCSRWHTSCVLGHGEWKPHGGDHSGVQPSQPLSELSAAEQQVLLEAKSGAATSGPSTSSRCRSSRAPCGSSTE